jgi:hypothetical protein
MMLQHSTDTDEQLQRRNSIYSLFVELAEVTDALTQKTTNDDFEELQSLVQRREVCIRELSRIHTMEYTSMMIYGVDDVQMKEIVSKVKQSSEQMQSVMEMKNKEIITALSNLQHQKMYQQ